jgi:uncharacterized SAM-binding protein YcdF (DUF218 family)
VSLIPSRLFSLVWSGLAVLGALVILVTFTPVVKLTAAAMAQDWYEGGGEVLVVLGGSMLVPGTDPTAMPGEDTYLRCVYAVWKLRTRSFRYVVVTGGSGAAEAMSILLVSHGIPQQSVLIENRADSTYTNALYTKRILEERYQSKSLPTVIVLTSDYHSWRARRVFERCGMRVRMVPVPDLAKRSGSLVNRWPCFLVLLSEFAKAFFYAASGRM